MPVSTGAGVAANVSVSAGVSVDASVDAGAVSATDHDANAEVSTPHAHAHAGGVAIFGVYVFVGAVICSGFGVRAGFSGVGVGV